MPGFVYILKNQKDRFYIGSTDNLERRLHQHKTGHTQTTKNMRNVMPVFNQEYSTLAQARKIELQLKKLKRKDYIEKIIKDGYIKIK